MKRPQKSRLHRPRSGHPIRFIAKTQNTARISPPIGKHSPQINPQHIRIPQEHPHSIVHAPHRPSYHQSAKSCRCATSGVYCVPPPRARAPQPRAPRISTSLRRDLRPYLLTTYALQTCPSGDAVKRPGRRSNPKTAGTTNHAATRPMKRPVQDPLLRCPPTPADDPRPVPPPRVKNTTNPAPRTRRSRTPTPTAASSSRPAAAGRSRSSQARRRSVSREPASKRAGGRKNSTGTRRPAAASLASATWAESGPAG
jgi:hypothetical protein